jgi:endonuclease/exonuclease/phosphatase family metal-dependent hydrolase
LSGGQIRWRVIQTILDAGYIDVYRQQHPADPGLTFPTWGAHVRLDYAFVPQRYGPKVTASEVVTAGPRTASDHFPLLLEVEDLVTAISA